MIELQVILAGGLTSNTVSAIAESAIGEAKTTDFKRMGVDSVLLKHLNTDAEKAAHALAHGVKVPAFHLYRDGNLIAKSDTYTNFHGFTTWLKLALKG
jgi:hypothetical protein